jgi:hypothetical protein
MACKCAKLVRCAKLFHHCFRANRNLLLQRSSPSPQQTALLQKVPGGLTVETPKQSIVAGQSAVFAACAVSAIIQVSHVGARDGVHAFWVCVLVGTLIECLQHFVCYGTPCFVTPCVLCQAAACAAALLYLSYYSQQLCLVLAGS